jgi:hypothetical protein
MSESLNGTPPKSFYWVAGVALVWNLMGIMAYVDQVTMSAETLAAMPDAQRALYENMPSWATAAFAIAVNAGALGCLLLVLKKAIALPVLMLSMAGVLVQMAHNFFVSDALEVMGAASAIFPVIVIGIGAYLIWFASNAKSKGWIS